MFTLISRRSSRVKPSYICTLCLANSLPLSELQSVHQLLAHESLSTTSNHGQADNDKASTTTKPKRRASVGRRKSLASQRGRSRLPISESRDVLSALRSSLLAEEETSKVPTPKSRRSTLEAASQKEKQSPKKIKASKTSKATEVIEPAPSFDSNTVKGRNQTKTTSAKEKGAGKKTKKTAISANDEDEGDSPRIVRTTSKKGFLTTAELRRQATRTALLNSKSAALLGRKIHEIGQNETRQALVKIIEDGTLSESDTVRAVRQLRSTLIQRVPTGPKDSTIASRVMGFTTIKDAIQNRPMGTRPSESRRSKATTRVEKDKTKVKPGPMKERKGLEIKTIDSSELKLTPVARPQPPVPSLSYGLERVLFNPGVYHLQDPRSRVFNFDPYLQTIMPVSEFDFTALKEYITSSRDDTLLATARDEKKKYTGSTSSMTSALAHFHFLLSQWRPINTGTLSQNFPVEYNTFTTLQRGPSAVFLRWKDGTYAIDADKEFDTANILSMLGKSMEKLLTLPTDEFERYRKQNSDQITEEERNEAEAFNYTTMGDFLLRSQLDAHDPRLPGTGMFDLKTRAVVSIRMDTKEYEQGVGYEIRGRHGEWESFEREYYDMIRAAFLKYSLQVRMGRMDGIFVAFHNTQRIFGFQYISLPEMDYALHGTEDTSIGDTEFKLSLELLNKVLDRATAKYPEKSLRLHFETRGGDVPFMYIFAEPVEEQQIKEIQESNRAAIEEFEQRVLGLNGTTEEEMSEYMSEEEKRNAEWESLRAKVEENMEKDELDVQEARAVVESVLEESEIFGSGAITAEEREKLINELLESASFGDDDAGALLKGVDRGDSNEDRIERVATDSGIDDFDEDDIDEDGDGHENDEEEAEEDDEGEVEQAREDQVEEGEEHESLAESSDIEVVGDENSVGQETTNEVGERPEIETFADQAEVQSLDGVGTGAPDKASENLTEGTESVQSRHIELVENEEVAGRAAEHSGDQASTGIENPATADGESNSDSFEQSLISEQLAATEEETKEDGKPEVLAMTLTIRNKVNGKYVDRPKNLHSEDKWTIEYALMDVTSQERTIVLYDAAKRRRSQILSNTKRDENNKWNNRYLENLRKLSQKGREWRKGQNEIDQAGPLKVLEERDWDQMDQKRENVAQV